MMKPIFKVSLYFLIVLVGSIIGQIFLGAELYKLGIAPPFRLIILHLVLFITPAIIYIVVTKSNYKKVFSLKKPRMIDIFYALLIAALSQPVMALFSYIASFFTVDNVSLMLNQMNTYPVWLMIIVVGVTPAITEEITIRGIVLSGFEFKGKNVAAIMSGILFGILHLNAYQFLYATVMGMILAYVVRATGSIYLSMLIHFSVNTFNLLLQRINNSGIHTDDLLHQINSMKNWPIQLKIELFFYYLIFAIVAVVLISFLIRRMEKGNLNITLDELDVATRVSYKEEKILNIPIILSFVVFISYTYFLYFR